MNQLSIGMFAVTNKQGKLVQGSKRGKSWKEPTFRRSVGSYGQTKMLETTSEANKKLGLRILRRNVCSIEQREKQEMTSKRDKSWAEPTFSIKVCSYEQSEDAKDY